MFAWIKQYVYMIMGIVFLVLAVAAVGFCLWGAHYKKANDRLRTDNAQCLGDNKMNIGVIEAMKAERANNNHLCEQRLSMKDGLIKRLELIDRLKEGSGDERINVSRDVESGGACPGVFVTGGFTGSSVLGALNGMYPSAGDAGGVLAGDVAPAATGAQLLSGQLVYCLDEVNAKNLLKNATLVQAWADDMRAIIESRQTSTGGVQ